MVIAMKKYESDIIGKIVIIKNIIFENRINTKKETDHSWFNGRPCLIIYSDNEWDYFLTLKSNFNKDKFDNQFFELSSEDILSLYYRNRELRSAKEIKGVVNLQNVYKMPISGHDEVGKIEFETYKKIIEKLKKYHNNQSLDDILIKSKTIR